MSSETSTWLNSNTLIGFTTKRGHAWHWRAQELFHWRAESRRVAVEVPSDPSQMTHVDDNGQAQRWTVSSTAGRRSAAPMTSQEPSWGSSDRATPATSTKSGS